MQGADDPPELRGIIPNAFEHIFEKILITSNAVSSNYPFLFFFSCNALYLVLKPMFIYFFKIIFQDFLVRCSYLEIYNEEIRDLLSVDPHAKKELRENSDVGVYVKVFSLNTSNFISEE